MICNLYGLTELYDSMSHMYESTTEFSDWRHNRVAVTLHINYGSDRVSEED